MSKKQQQAQLPTSGGSGEGPSSGNPPTCHNGYNNNNGDDEGEDECCVYTYKGDSRTADLPSSFFHFSPPPLQQAQQEQQQQQQNNGRPQNGLNELNSPDMDFLEMDFDPGGPGHIDESDEEEDDSRSDNFVLRGETLAAAATTEAFEVDRLGLLNSCNSRPSGNNGRVRIRESEPCCSKSLREQNSGRPPEEMPLDNSQPNNIVTTAACHVSSTDSASSSYNPPEFVQSPPPQPPPLSIRLVKSNTLPEMGSSSSASSTSSTSSSAAGDVVAPRISTLSSSTSIPTNHQALVASVSAPTITHGPFTEKSIDLKVNGAMIWSLKEAVEISVGQIGASACGATAIINVMHALGLPPVAGSTVNECVGTRLRQNDADLPEYLFSRAVAGATHEDLIAGMEKASGGAVVGRFFQPSPNLSSCSLIKWLLSWICKGAVPVMTLNLQIVPPSTPGSPPTEINDAWHHQMVFGVTEEGVFLTNPVEIASTSVLLPQLTSPSVLLVRRQDVVSRKGSRTDLRKLVRHTDQRWNDLNVLGQVSNMVLEEMPIFNGSSVAKRVRSTHITIPAAYKAGVTLFVRKNNEELLTNDESLLL